MGNLNPKLKELEKIEYVLDTSILIYEPGSIYKFKEHNVTLFQIVLQELDGLKKGHEEKAVIVRDLHRKLDMLGDKMIPEPPKNGAKKNKKPIDNNKPIEMVSALYNGGVSLGEGLGNIEIKNMALQLHPKLRNYYSSDIGDHHILSGVLKLKDQSPRKKVILVSKDINLRMKAKSLGIQVQDYRNDQVPLEEHSKPIRNLLSNPLLSKAIDILDKRNEAPISGESYSEVIDKTALYPNMGLILRGEGKSNCLVRIDSKKEKMIKLKEKLTVSSITSRNAEQTFLIDAIINSGSSLILASGIAGTGKTLLAMASAIYLVVIERRFFQIVTSAPMVTVGDKERGALPGDAIEKTKPYMLGLHQNLNFIKSSLNGEFKKNKELISVNDSNNRQKHSMKKIVKKTKKVDNIVKVEEKNFVTLLEEENRIQIQPMSYIRGGTFNNTIIIVDESQNMTPHEAKTIITRAGNNTMVILCGDIEQIDSPYMSDRSNGFSYTRYKMGDKEVTASIHLVKGERSYLASLAAECM